MKKLIARICRSLSWRLNLLAKEYESLNSDDGKAQSHFMTPHDLWVRDNGDKTLRLDYQLYIDDIVLDVGGYEGQWASDIYSKYLCTVHIFEPIPHYASMIEKRFANNKNIHLYKVALGKLNDEIEFSIAGDASSALVGGDIFIKANVVAFHDWYVTQGIKSISLMKINIEGGEYDLLEHLIETGLICFIENLQIQFHDFFPEAEQRMHAIQASLHRTHALTYQYNFIWENWKLKESH